jgi:hypothetical protein
MFFSLLISNVVAQSVSNATYGFVPIHAECINIKTSLCSIDATCMALDAAIIGTMMSFEGFEGFYGQMPAGMVGVAGVFPPQTLAATLAQFAFMVSYNATGGALTQIYPSLNAVYECEARNEGLVWAQYADTWSAVQICFEDADCLAAFDSIREASSDKPPAPFGKFGSTWTFIPEIDFWMPLAVDNDNDAYCGIVFAALAEENIKAINGLIAWATLNLNGDDLLGHCNDAVAKYTLGLVAGLSAGCLVFGLLVMGLGCYCCNGRKKDAI